jgi:hypothetical protein
MFSLICLSLFFGFGAGAEEHYLEWGGNDTNLDVLVEHLNELIYKQSILATHLLSDVL